MDKNIIQIGVYDAKLTKFENQYPTPEGITYNSYLIIDDKIAVVDTVDARAADRWFDNLLGALPQGRTPDYLIVEHLEPDHSSQIARLMHRFPDCRIICSAAAARMLPAVVGTDEFKDRITSVGEGDTLPLGSHTLTFLLAPMIHWPEVMMVYVPESGVLFSADAFGRFGHPEASEWAEEGARYYLNIVGKYGKPVQNLIAKLRDKDIRTIAPLHGPVLSGDLTPYFDLYRKWSSYEHEDDGVLIAVASIHGLTAWAALRVAELLKQKGVKSVTTIKLTHSDMSQAVREAFRMKHIILMASTYDGDVFTPMADFLHRLALKGYCNRSVAIVENGLWAPVAGKKMKAAVEAMPGMKIAEPIVTLRGHYTDENITQLTEMVDNLLSL